MSGQFMTSPNFKLILYYHSEGRAFDLKMLQAFSFININVKAKRILQGLWIYHVCVQGFLLLKEYLKKRKMFGDHWFIGSVLSQGFDVNDWL